MKRKKWTGHAGKRGIRGARAADRGAADAADANDPVAPDPFEGLSPSVYLRGVKIGRAHV